MAKQISVIERRLQGPSVLYQPSQPIPMKEKGWELRWVNNSTERPDEAYRKVNVLGWVYVEPQELACDPIEVGAKVQDNRIVRGERGSEVLLKMRTSDWKKVVAQKAKETHKLTFDKKTVQSDILNRVGSEHGSEAADFIQKSGLSVVDSRGEA